MPASPLLRDWLGQASSPMTRGSGHGCKIGGAQAAMASLPQIRLTTISLKFLGRPKTVAGPRRAHRLVATTSRYSAGATTVWSPERLKRSMTFIKSPAKASRPAWSRASKAFTVGP